MSKLAKKNGPFEPFSFFSDAYEIHKNKKILE